MNVDEAHELRILSRRITAALVVVAVVAMVFTAVSVTTFALDHGVSPWVAWTLDPMVAVALLVVLLADARLVELGAAPSGWATALRWFAGMATWTMNAWSSVWPDGGFGVPRDVDPAGVVLHSVAPVLLVVLAEAATGYRRVIAERLRVLAVADATDSQLPASAELVAVEEAPSSWDEPWRAPWSDHSFDRSQALEIPARVVAPVVAGWSSETAVDDQADDHLGDQPDTPAAPVHVVEPVVPEAVAYGPQDDQEPPSDADLRRAARALHRRAVKDGRAVTVETLRVELGVSRRRAADLRREVMGTAS